MSYGYEEYIDITPNQLLQKVSQQQIFELVLQEQFSYYRQYKSPLRQEEDTRAGCRFEQRPDGTILWVDFGDIPTHRTCFKLLMDYHKVDLQGAVRIICQSLGISTSSIDYAPDLIPQPLHFEEPLVPKAEIGYDRKKYTVKDVRYWAGTITSIENLEEDNTFSVGRVRVNNIAKQRKVNFTPAGLCYVFDFLDAVKIYQPYNSTHRFITNCNENHIGNIDNLPAQGDRLIIAKAYKDHRVFRNLHLGTSYSVIWFQNEGQIPRVETLINLASRFKRVVIFFDNDVPGVIAAIKLATMFNAIRGGCAIIKHIPFEYPQKDLGEFILKEGRNDTIKLLNHIRL